MRYTFFILLMVLFSINLNAQNYNILDFGAKPDGKTLSTNSIQSAINAANKNGGGTVIFPKGKFLSGAILLKSNVELHLEKEATLLGVTDSKYSH